MKSTFCKTLQKYVSMRPDDGEVNKEKFVDYNHLLHAQILQVEEFLPKVRSNLDFERLWIKSQELLLNKAEHLVRDWHCMPFEKKRSIVESFTK